MGKPLRLPRSRSSLWIAACALSLAATIVLAPTAAYECADLPNQPSESGDISTPVKQIRDPFVFEDEGRTFLFYSVCGEQGIAAARIDLP